MSTSQAYFAIRSRMVATAAELTDIQLATTVPACPAWTIHDLVVHVASMPHAILAGDIPDGPDPNPWIEGLIQRHRSKSLDETVSWWQSNDDALRALVDQAGLLTVDLFIHESDLHGALESDGHRAAPELAEQLGSCVATFGAHIASAGLGPVVIETELGRFATGEGEPDWTLQVSAWEAHRIVNSRRTAAEIRALPSTGNPDPYLVLLDEHLPLPTSSLGE